MNREDNYYYNGSGYADPTAAAVINKITKEIHMIDPKPFEIWQFADGSTALVTAVSDYNMQYVKIFNTSSGRPDEIEISGRYFNPHYLAYSFTDNCTNFLRVLKDDEVSKVKSAIASVFGVTMGDDSDEVYELKQELNGRKSEMSEMRKALDAANNTIAQLRHGLPGTSELEKKISSQQIMIDLLIEKLTEARCGKE